MAVDAKTVKAIFLDALDKPAPADRAAYLDQACAGDAALRQSVEALLKSHDRPDALLDQPAVQHLPSGAEGPTLDFLDATTRPGALGRLGHYDVLEAVGQGGMGVVMRAFDAKLHRVVAIKALFPGLAANREARQRFVREAQAAAAVTHDNVISIHAVDDEGPVPYLVMQYIEGCTLQAKIDRAAPLPLKEILRIGLQISEGLAAAHRHGLIHRDIKPANILLENGIQRVKITDFGLARTVDDTSLTRSGYIAGTPPFMSPEQADGKRVDHRSDLFSLGSVLYALCSGHPPFQAESTVAILKRVCEETPRPLREINPDIPEWLQEVIAKLHAKNPADRFDSAAEVATLLSKRLAQLQSGAEPSAVVPAPKPAQAEPTRLPAAAARPDKRKPLLWAALALLVAGAGWAGWYFTRNPSGGQTADNSGNPGAQPAPSELPKEPILLTPVKKLTKHTDGVMAVAISPNGKVLATAGKDKVIFLWDMDSWQARGPLTGHPNSGDVSWLAFSPDGTKLASVSTGPDTCCVRLWDVATAKPANPLGGESRGMWGVDWSRDGTRVAAGGWDQIVRVWDVASGEERAIPDACEKFVRGLAFSPKGDIIAVGGKGPVKLWDANTRQEIPSAFPRDMCPSFFPAGDRIAGWTYATGFVTICAAPSGEVLAAWRAHTTAPIEGLTVSPDGRFIVSLGKEGVAKLWTTYTDEPIEVATLKGHQGSVYTAAFTPDGSRLVTTGFEDATVRLWDLPPVCRVRKQ